MKYIIMYGIMLNALTGCTYSINMVHTEGSASDVVDETQSAHPNIVPTLNIPVKAI